MFADFGQLVDVGLNAFFHHARHQERQWRHEFCKKRNGLRVHCHLDVGFVALRFKLKQGLEPGTARVGRDGVQPVGFELGDFHFFGRFFAEHDAGFFEFGAHSDWAVGEHFDFFDAVYLCGIGKVGKHLKSLLEGGVYRFAEL